MTFVPVVRELAENMGEQSFLTEVALDYRAGFRAATRGEDVPVRVIDSPHFRRGLADGKAASESHAAVGKAYLEAELAAWRVRGKRGSGPLL